MHLLYSCPIRRWGYVIGLTFFFNSGAIASVSPNYVPPTETFNTSSLSGSVTDASTGASLAGASIYFSDLKTGAAADAQGHYVIINLPPGKHLVEVSSLGYSTIAEYVFVDGQATKDFVLTASVAEHSEVVVTGFSNTQAKNAAIPVTIVKREELYKSAATNIIDAISKQPGITKLTTGPAISKPYIRGLGYTRVLTISNGVRQEGQQWGDEHGIEVDDYNVDKVEILKGPASLMYGSDGLAGVINIISNTPVPQGSIKGNVNTNYQSNNGLYALNANLAGNINGLNWNAYATGKTAHDYRNRYDGYVFNSRFNNMDLGGYIGLNKTWGYSHLTYSSFNQQLGLVEGERDDSTGQFLKITGIDDNGEETMALTGINDHTSYQPQVPRQQISHQKVVLDNAFYFQGKGHLTLTTGWQLSERKEFADVTQPDIPGLYFHLQTITYDVKYFLPSKHNWQTTFGIGGMQQRNVNSGTEVLIPAYSFFDLGGFVYTKKTYKKAAISGGLRFDNRNLVSHHLELDESTKFEAFKKTFANVSASLGVTYDLTKVVTAKFNISRGFRAPNIAELGANGVHEGTIKYEYGNTGLSSETSFQVDGGIDINTEHFTFSGDLFYNNINNYIFSRKLESAAGNDSIPTVDNDAQFAAFKYFQTDAHLYGAEFVMDIHPHPLDWIHFQNTVSFVRGISGYNTDSTRNLPNIPAGRWLSELRAEFKKAGNLFTNVYARIEWDITLAQNNAFTAYETETPTRGYALLNAGIGGNIINGKKKQLFGLYIAASNLTDVAYQNHLSRLKYAPENMVTGRYGIYNIGRNFSVKLNIPLLLKE